MYGLIKAAAGGKGTLKEYKKDLLTSKKFTHMRSLEDHISSAN